MPLFETNQTNHSANQQTQNSTINQTDNCGFDTQTNPQNQTQANPANKSGLLTIIGQLLPLAPFAFEQFTGQKVPHMSGTMAEIQLALTHIQANCQTIAQNQQQLAQRLTNLETNAVQQLTSLTHQFKSLRLTHTKEQKQIEFDRPQPETENY